MNNFLRNKKKRKKKKLFLILLNGKSHFWQNSQESICGVLLSKVFFLSEQLSSLNNNPGELLLINMSESFI